jgi:cleavage and polyadenylation specificity factor subunit 3
MQKQKVFCRAPLSLVKWHLENMYGKIETLDEKSFRVFDTVNVTALEDNQHLVLEWKGDTINDMIADSVLAVIIQAESSPASVKGLNRNILIL